MPGEILDSGLVTLPASSAFAGITPSAGSESGKVGANRWTVVTVDTSGNAIASPGGSNVNTAVGVSQGDQPVAGSGVPVLLRHNGVSRIRAGAAVAVGDVLGVDSSGRAITWTTGDVIGHALTAASAAEQIIVAII